MLVSPAELADTTELIAEPTPRPLPAAPADAAASGEVLITTQQVLFSTAAAVGAPRESTRGRLVAAMRRMFAPSTKTPRERPRYQPKRYAYIEHAAMARAMERL